MIINAANYSSGFTITTSAGENGYITPTFSVLDGTDAVVKIYPNAGYIPSDVIIDGVSIGPIMEYTFYNTKANHTISVTFTNTYTSISTFEELQTYLGSTHSDIGVLSADFTVTENISISTVNTLDLHGHTITGGGSSSDYDFRIQNGGNFTLCDLSIDGSGKITSFRRNTSGGFLYMSSSSGNAFTMNGGNITGCSATNSGGAICMDGGVFTMNAGNITGCSATGWAGSGGGIIVASGTFIMNGGNISGCSATQFGGGVSISSRGAFTMSGGIICQNTAGGSKGGVSGTYTKTGGYVGGNTPQE